MTEDGRQIPEWRRKWRVGLLTDRDTAAQLLNLPLAAQTADTAAVTRITRRLEDWVRAETEIKL